MAKLMDMEPAQINTITHGSTIKGNVVANGDFRLDGTLNGNIQLNGKLVVGESGVINGNAVCQNANIIGTILGNISVKELLSLHSTANVKGDILINKLSIEPGAVFSGTCKMLDEVRRENEAMAQSQQEVKE
ncbi:MAG: Integral membrane protein CcmA involved in cell shape determination [bacterium P3]|nr:MAG: Integral membrane protein CcmA involved in cell shape determination [bacterium P3]KWW42063.1 MAG: Integral membrane protein CcmA involved in cell shape determination [bacterium F083]